MVAITNTTGLTGTSVTEQKSGTDTVALHNLTPRPEWIACPSCHKTTQTRVEGRSKGMKTFMNIMWWPLPRRRQWWEKTHWFCQGCGEEVATQRFGHEVKPGKREVESASEASRSE